MILFEGNNYSLIEEVKERFPGIKQYLQKDILRCVGYFRHEGEMTFILPKSFANILPDSNNNYLDFKDIKGLERATELSLWVYGAIDRYRNRLLGTSVDETVMSEVIATSKTDNHSTTLLDHIIAMRNFFERNKNLILMTYKEIHRGYNRINWAKTVRKKTPIISERKQVAYTEVYNERRHINDQEELMVLYFSTMRYVHRQYGINMPTSPYYRLLADSEFEILVDCDMILGRLNGIRQQYFSDKMCELWRLLYAFHQELSSKKYNQVTKQGSSNYQDEYLLATDFDRIFEDMIDFLISDPDLTDLKKHADNRRIDHIFLGKSLIDPQSKVYYIGDSKYYDIGSDIDDISKAKQFDYAHNIIQMARDRSNGKNGLEQLNKDVADSYYDPKTHGYTITPNFFIRPKDESIFEDELRFEAREEVNETYQHKGCLFDRSTLFLFHFEINLYYVLKTYALDNTPEKEKAKKMIEESVWNKMNEYINENYYFRTLRIPWTIFQKSVPVNIWLGRTFHINHNHELLFAVPKTKNQSSCLTKRAKRLAHKINI